MSIHLPQTGRHSDVSKHYDLHSKVDKAGYVYTDIQKGIYGLPESGILAQKLLEERLATKGYYQSMYTPGLWLHKWRPISFSLCVDDFGVKYVGDEHKAHLLD